MPKRAFYLSILCLLLAGCQGRGLIFAATPTPTASPTPAGTSTPTPLPPLVVAIDPTVTRQTLREVGGGNYIHYFGGVETALDPVSTLNLKTLKPDVVRVRIDLDQWEPTAGVSGEARFHNERHVKATFEFMQTARRENPNLLIAASVWKIADWMVANPEQAEGRVIPPEKYAAVIDSLAHWLMRARDEYGVEVDYISFNEANIGITVLMSSAEQVEFIRQAGPAFTEMGLKTRWLLGDASSMAAAASYTPPSYAAEDIRPYLGPYSFHSWDSQVTDLILKEIGKFVDENGLEAWCTEAGWDPQQWNRPAEFPTWRHALKLANIYTRVLRDTRATTMLYWEMMGRDYSINDGQNPFPALLYLAELKRHFPAGAQIVQTPDREIETITVLSLAAKTPNGFAVQLVNQVNSERMVLLTGLPAGAYRLVRLSEAGGGRQELEAPLTTSDGQLQLTLPASSITFLSTGAPE